MSKIVEDQDEFQVIVSSEDYKKLSTHTKLVEELTKENENLKKLTNQLKSEVKDLRKTVYIRDSFIELLSGEFLQIFGTILGVDIISDDSISKSFYQQIVTHQQNGVSSIQMRHAMDLYTSQNCKIFQQMEEVAQLFASRDTHIAQLEKELKPHREASKMQKVQQLSKIEELNKSQHELNLIRLQTKCAREKLDQVNAKVKIHEDECKKIEKKQSVLKKEYDELTKKREKTNDKSYMIKLLVDDYYAQLQKNLLSVGGLNQDEIKTVIQNELKGIVYYIEALTRKMNKKI